MINRKFLKLFALLMLVVPMSMSAYDASYYASSSRLSSGRWVKIKVSQTGIHQLSYETLRKMGFDNPAKVAVFGYGGVRLTSNEFAADLPDDIMMTPVYHTPDSRLLFYAEAGLSVTATTATTVDARRNLYDSDAYYFLTDSHEPEDLPSALDNMPAGESANTHLSVFYIENDKHNPANGGAIFHDTPFGPGDICEYDFEIKDFHPDEKYPSGFFKYSFAAFDWRQTNLDPIYPAGLTVSKIENGFAPLETQQTKFYTVGNGSASLDAVSGDGIYTVGFRLASGREPRYSAMDYAWLVYPRLNKLSSNSLVMNYPGMKTADCLTLTDCDTSVKVWDITDAAAVKPCQVYYDGTKATAVCPESAKPAAPGRRLIAFRSSSQFPEAEIVGEVANQNLHGESVPVMVIITTDEFAAAAERLANIHRQHDTFDVKVVTQEKIFNEFSSGTRSAMGYRRYLKMLYDRKPAVIRYVLFYGHGSWDNRRKVAREELLCYETENVDQARDYTKSFTSDKYFVMLENNFDPKRLHFGIMSLSVGRIDLSTEAEADQINAKIERFLKRGRGHDVYGNVLVISDDGDNQGHFLDSESMIKEMEGANQTMTFTRVHNLIYPWEGGLAMAARKSISHALKSGQGLFAYTGHCSHVAFASERIYDTNLITEAKCDDYPFALLATCETFGFDRNSQLLGPAMLRADNGGAIGIIGSCRSVYMEYNRTHARAVARAYARAMSTTSIGDVVREAHNFCVRSYREDDRAANTMCYNLCGDPSLRVGAPSATVYVDKVNGDEVNEYESVVEIPALKTVTIEGHIEGTKNFNGTAIVRVYDTPNVVKTNERSWEEDLSVSYDVTLDEKVIASTCTNVVNSNFVAKITVPEPTGEGNCRLTISAISNNKKVSGAYASTEYKVLPYDNCGDIDTSQPEITEMYIGTPSFVDGSLVGNSIVLHASINVPPAGLDMSSTFGSGLRLMLDDRTSYPTAQNALVLNPDNTASLTYSIDNLADGRHELSLLVASATGVVDSRTIGFTVIDGSVTCSLEADTDIARESIAFNLEHGFYTQPTGRFIIEDASGTTVFSADNCSFPYDWNLRDNSGEYVPDGSYRAYGVLHDDNNYSSTPAFEFTVIR